MNETFAREVIDRLARIETTQASDAEASQHRHNNLKMIMNDLATKKEVEAVEDRVASLEDDKKWIVRGIVGAWFAGSGVVLYLSSLSRKLGI